MRTEILISGQGGLVNPPFLTHPNTHVHFDADVPVMFMNGDSERLIIYIGSEKPLWFCVDSANALFICTTQRAIFTDAPIAEFIPGMVPHV